MKTLDLTKLSKYHVEREIRTVCGGYINEKKWLSGFNIGIGGLMFTDTKGSNTPEKYKVVLANYKNGIGLYFRNVHSNYLVLIAKDKIRKIEIIKEKDVIKPMKLSIFNLLLKVGFPSEKAVGYLAPNEIISENPAFCIIKTEDYFIQLQLEKTSPQKLVSTLKKSDFNEFVHENINKPEILRS